MPALPRSNIHLDILMGRDETLDVSDIFQGICLYSNSTNTRITHDFIEREVAPPLDIHADMERRLRML